MRILGSVVAPSTALMAYCDSKIMGCGGIDTLATNEPGLKWIQKAAAIGANATSI
jgi:hypothetical protein